MKTDEPFVLDLPGFVRDEPVVVAVNMSLGLAQFLTDIEMCDHPRYDRSNPHHQLLIKEFVEVKKQISNKVQPLIDLHNALQEFLHADDN